MRKIKIAKHKQSLTRNLMQFNVWPVRANYFFFLEFLPVSQKYISHSSCLQKEIKAVMP